ncbi:amidohydrolase [Brachybacterium sp. DNPG3]
MTDPASAPTNAAPTDPAMERISAAYAARRLEIHDLARAIHADPELSFAEHRAASRCIDLLELAGFTVEHPVGGIGTAFRARRGSGSLTAALCVEYDALPGVGHGCGHHLIAGSSLGAALALAEQLDAADVAGEALDLELVVIGTPAEEHGGGKQLLIDAGVFDGVDLALMTHAVGETGTYDVLGSTSQAVGRWRATYTGRGAHAAANPADGINANDAAVVAQVAAGLLRQRMKDGQRMALVPQQDGVTNIVPETAVVDAECRALTMDEFETLRERMFDCLRAGALAAGCEITIEASEPTYEPLTQDETLGRLWNDAMVQLGRPLAGSLGIMAASTDMGNVSRRVPALHPFVGIPGVADALHTTGFAAASLRPEAFALMDDAARAMAWIIRSVAADDDLRAAVRRAGAALGTA